MNPLLPLKLHSFPLPPTLAFYFDLPLEEAIRRIMDGRPTLKYYEAGMDLGLADDLEDSFRIYQGLIKLEYDRVVDEFGLVRIDATKTLIRSEERRVGKECKHRDAERD